MSNKPVAYVDPIWMDRPDLVMNHQLEIGKLFARTQFTNYVPLYTHPVKEQSTNERIEMLKEMVEKIANPVGWIGYQEGHLVSFLRTQKQVNSFLTATDPTGKVEPVYTHPVKELTDEEIDELVHEYNCIDDYPHEFVRACIRKASEK